VQNAAHHSQKLRAETRQFQATELEALTAQSQRVDQQLKRLQDALGTIQSHDQVSQKAIAAVKDILKETEVNVRNGLKTWSANLADSSDALCKEMEGTGAAAFAAVRAFFLLHRRRTVGLIIFCKTDGESVGNDVVADGIRNP
jgi:kinesin family protein 11